MPISPNPGLSPAVQKALQRRQSTPMMSQTSPQAPMQDQAPQPMNQSELTQSSAPSGQAPQQKFEPQNQEDLIVQALIEQLKNTNKLKKEQTKMSTGTPSVENNAGGGNPFSQYKSYESKY